MQWGGGGGKLTKWGGGGASGGGEEDGGAPPPTPGDVVSVCGDRQRQSVSQCVSQPQPYLVCQSECVSVGTLVSVSVTVGGGRRGAPLAHAHLHLFVSGKNCVLLQSRLDFRSQICC